ncbi:Xaa-Pro peptidase family protein [Phaeobacter sp. QD34_3]|uniref:M24 family metallopeptidase n=1 Tax=unclassified Phaeobacter TaxID=2621772 RepID=UPI00237FC134|nr:MULTISPECIES: Xaa-Pro peptidase family protein [unclassified Phaeobacter]MDE4132778.1 Xaa-Pro peptidase family protein [Phaeobacter sp. QD34_3]MDE4136429.1 Xaa-Pro peptidase family protein [Phaeobacter sp. QD34_24]
MADPARGFALSEYRRRCDALQAGMALAGMDALLLTTAADIFYVTGFLTRFWESPARPWFVVVPAKGDPVAVIPSIGADLMGQTWISDIRTWDAPDPSDDGVSLLAATLCDLVPAEGAIGTPMGLETQLRMALSDYMALTARIAPRRMVDATDVVQRVREVKSEAEVAKIRAACAVADRTFARVPEFAGLGRPLDAVFRDFQRVLLEEGADWVSYTAGGAGQGGYGDVISPATAQPLARGDVLMLDTGAVRDGYFCDFDRNYAIGAVAVDTALAHAALYAATELALDTLRPGMTAADVHRILCDGLGANGATPGGGRLGHGLGVTLTEWPSFTPKDRSVLRAGMVLTLEPGVEIAPGRILVHEENIVLREDGPELLSARAPAELPVLE